MGNREKAEFPKVASAFSSEEVIKSKSHYTGLLSPGRKTQIRVDLCVGEEWVRLSLWLMGG